MLYPDHQTRALLVREHSMQVHTRRIRLLAAAGAIAALGVITATIDAAVASDATPSLPVQNPSAATATLPGDSPVPFWPYETGARVGTSETYVDVRMDGSYFDPGIGQRVSVAAEGSSR
jgi:hypothetical protein